MYSGYPNEISRLRKSEIPPQSPMSDCGRVSLIVALSLGSLVTIRGSNFLLGSVLALPAEVGIPLVPVIASLGWLAPLLFFPSLRDVGSFRLRRTWTVWLILPVVALNWTFSMFFVSPVWLPWNTWLFWVGKGMATGVFEELIIRGYAFRRLPHVHPRLVVITSAFCFSLIHAAWLLDGRPVVAVLSNVAFALIVGLALSLIRMISGSLAWCMFLHGAINAAFTADVPGVLRSTFYVLALTAMASGAVLWRHPVFRRGTILAGPYSPRLL